jgi:hypothetical protein
LKGTWPKKRPQSSLSNPSCNISEVLEDREEVEKERVETCPFKINLDLKCGSTTKDQEEIENTIPNTKDGTSFGVSSIAPQEKEP